MDGRVDQVDHHENEPDVYMRDLNKKYDMWLRENLVELGFDSAHIILENLRELAVKTLFKNGFIYKYTICSIN